jgi:hypothetical protein
MYPELVGAPGPGPQKKEGMGSPGADYFVKSKAGFTLPPIRGKGKLFSVPWVPKDITLYAAGIFPGGSGYQGRVSLADGPVLKLTGQKGEGLIVIGGDDDAGSVFVQAVDDSGPEAGASGTGGEGVPVLAAKKQGIGQGPPPVARAGMDHHPLGLVHYRHPVILVKHVKGNILRDKLSLHLILPAEFESITSLEHPGNPDFFSVEGGAEAADLDLGTAEEL